MDPSRQEASAARDVETWLRTEAAVAYDELRTDPSLAVTGEEMRTKLAARHAARVEDQRRT